MRLMQKISLIYSVSNAIAKHMFLQVSVHSRRSLFILKKKGFKCS